MFKIHSYSRKIIDVLSIVVAFQCIVIVLWCVYDNAKMEEAQKTIKKGYDLYLNGTKVDASKIDIDNLHGTVKIDDEHQEVCITTSN